MAVWALSRLVPAKAFDDLRRLHLPGERDGGVAEEWTAADG
jgi:hypothetical protein